MPKKIRQDRRKHKDIRLLILKSLINKKLSIHEIAVNAGVNWRTTELHLTFLKGKEYVAEIFRHKQLRIFELTKEGKKFMLKNG